MALSKDPTFNKKAINTLPKIRPSRVAGDTLGCGDVPDYKAGITWYKLSCNDVSCTWGAYLDYNDEEVSGAQWDGLVGLTITGIDTSGTLFSGYTATSDSNSILIFSLSGQTIAPGSQGYLFKITGDVIPGAVENQPGMCAQHVDGVPSMASIISDSTGGAMCAEQYPMAVCGICEQDGGQKDCNSNCCAEMDGGWYITSGPDMFSAPLCDQDVFQTFEMCQLLFEAGCEWNAQDPIDQEDGFCAKPCMVEDSESSCCLPIHLGCDNVCYSNLPEDCAGVCGGSAVEDECGCCGGNGIVPDDGECFCNAEVPCIPFILDCQQVCGGSVHWDNCGECGGDGQRDCSYGGNGIPGDPESYCGTSNFCPPGYCDTNGNNKCVEYCPTLDICGLCGGEGDTCDECLGDFGFTCGGIPDMGIDFPHGCYDKPENDCDCDGNIFDCANECGGDAEEDVCGDCGGDVTNPVECPEEPWFENWEDIIPESNNPWYCRHKSDLIPMWGWETAPHGGICTGNGCGDQENEPVGEWPESCWFPMEFNQSSEDSIYGWEIGTTGGCSNCWGCSISPTASNIGSIPESKIYPNTFNMMMPYTNGPAAGSGALFMNDGCHTCKGCPADYKCYWGGGGGSPSGSPGLTEDGLPKWTGGGHGIDECGTCGGSYWNWDESTGEFSNGACNCQGLQNDCNGDCNGNAFIDYCKAELLGGGPYCVGGNTGESPYFKDYEGICYPTVVIGSTIWMTENLKTTKRNRYSSCSASQTGNGYRIWPDLWYNAVNHGSTDYPVSDDHWSKSCGQWNYSAQDGECGTTGNSEPCCQVWTLYDNQELVSLDTRDECGLLYNGCTALGNNKLCTSTNSTLGTKFGPASLSDWEYIQTWMGANGKDGNAIKNPEYWENGAGENWLGLNIRGCGAKHGVNNWESLSESWTYPCPSSCGPCTYNPDFSFYGGVDSEGNYGHGTAATFWIRDVSLQGGCAYPWHQPYITSVVEFTEDAPFMEIVQYETATVQGNSVRCTANVSDFE